MPETTVAIDCRMVNHSGIGNCIKGWLPHIFAHLHTTHFVLLGNPKELADLHWTAFPNITIRNFSAPIYSIREQIAWQTLSGMNFDLLWVPHFNIPYLWSGPLLVTIHDLIYLRMREFFRPATRLYAKLLLTRVRQRADAVFFVSQFTCNEFLEIVGPPNGLSTVIYNGIDELWFKSSPRLQLPNDLCDCPYVVCVGNVKPHKNIRRLIHAFKLIIDRIPHRLVIVGKKEGFITGDPGVASLADRLGDRIRFTGFLPDETLRAIVAHATLLIFPSLYEGFGLPPLEALASGVQVLASRIPPVVEMCGEQITYFDPYDTRDLAEKLLRLCSSTAASVSSQSIARFRWPSAAERVVALMKQTLTSHIEHPTNDLTNRH